MATRSQLCLGLARARPCFLVHVFPGCIAHRPAIPAARLLGPLCRRGRWLVRSLHNLHSAPAQPLCCMLHSSACLPVPACADGQAGHASELMKLVTKEPKHLAEQAQQALSQKAWLRPAAPPQKAPPQSSHGDLGQQQQQQQLSEMPPWATPPADAQVSFTLWTESHLPIQPWSSRVGVSGVFVGSS